MLKSFATFFLLVSAAFAIGPRYDGIVLRDNGRPAAAATIRVCANNAASPNCPSLQSVYYDAALTTPKSNPVVADGLGNFYFYAAAGTYHLEISGPGIATPRVYNDISMLSPTAGTGSVTSIAIAFSSDVTCSPTITTAGTITCTFVTAPSGTGGFARTTSPTFITKITTPNVVGVEAAAPSNIGGTTWQFAPITTKGWCVISPSGTQYCPSQNTSPLSIKGQLYGHNGTIGVAVGAPGSDGLVLTSNSAAAPGMDWQTPGSGGGGTPTAPLPAPCYLNSTVNFSNTATAHTLHSCVFAANATNVLDRIIRLHVQGIISTAATGPTLLMAVVISGVITLQSTTFTLPGSLAGAGWSVDCDITRTVTGASGATSNYCTFIVAGVTASTPLIDVQSTASGNGTLWDPTVSQTMAVQETFGTASAANSITARYSIFEQVNK